MTKKMKIIVLIIILSIFSITFYSYKINATSRGVINKIINKIEGKTLNDKFQTKVKSGNLSTDYNIDQALDDIDKLRLNTLNIPIVINVDNSRSSNMTVDNGSKKRVIDLINKLEGKKINIILEAYPWIENGSVEETKWKSDNSYFERTNNNTNTVDDLKDALQSTTIYNRNQNVKQEIKNFYDKYKKPIFFG